MIRYALTFLAVALSVLPAGAQDADPPATTPDPRSALDSDMLRTSSIWCKDSGTVCWNDQRIALSGIRLVGELRLGTIFGGGGDRLEERSYSGLSVIGVETNLYHSFVGAHLSVVAPGTVRFDEQSDVVRNGILLSADRVADVDWGLNFGVTLFDGALFAGGGYLFLDSRDFAETAQREDVNEGYFFVSVQAISAIRAVAKR